MTEMKRFTVVNHNEYAEGDLIYYDNGEELGSLDVVDILNNLNDENQQLQERNNRQAKQLHNIYQLIENKDWKNSKE